MYTNYSSSYYPSTTTTSADGVLGVFAALFTGVYLIIVLAVAALMVVSYWRIFTKAGEEGWKAIIPFYNNYIMCKISGTPIWVFILTLIPCVNIVGLIIYEIMVNINLSKVFNKSAGYTVGLILLPYVFYPMLAFGKTEYTAPVEA